jgi:hypothetical protein
VTEREGVPVSVSLTPAERIALEMLIDRFGHGWVDDLVEWLSEAIAGMRDAGLADDEVRDSLMGHAHDVLRHRSELHYLACRGIIRTAIEATSRDYIEAG